MEKSHRVTINEAILTAARALSTLISVYDSTGDADECQASSVGSNARAGNSDGLTVVQGQASSSATSSSTPSVNGESRFYCVWSVNGSYDAASCGIYSGSYPQVWNQLLQTTRVDSPKKLYLRRYDSEATAISQWQADCPKKYRPIATFELDFLQRPDCLDHGIQATMKVNMVTGEKALVRVIYMQLQRLSPGAAVGSRLTVDVF